MISNRQFHCLMSLLLLDTSLLFRISGDTPLMWGFGVMAVMTILPVFAYGCARIMVAVSAWHRSNKRRKHGCSWFDDDGDSTDS